VKHAGLTKVNSWQQVLVAPHAARTSFLVAGLAQWLCLVPHIDGRERQICMDVEPQDDLQPGLCKNIAGIEPGRYH